MARIEVDLRPLIAPGIATLIGAALLAGSWFIAGAWLDERERAFRQARGRLAQAASQYRNASDDQAVYEQYAARFREMGERGWIGPEQRLSWIEALQRANRDLKLPTLRYDIAQREPASLNDVAFDTRRLQLHRTPMRLTLGTLHEGDVLALLDRLSRRGRGLMGVRSCRLERAQPPGRVRLVASARNVQAVCALDWYTLEIQPEDDGT